MNSIDDNSMKDFYYDEDEDDEEDDEDDEDGDVPINKG